MLRLLDLYCGGGGASAGYVRAGVSVLGVDIEPKSRLRYPFPMVQADALEFLRVTDLTGFDVIHASPPCQQYSSASGPHRLRGAAYPDLIGPTREALEATGLPWVLENVPDSPLRDPILLCGAMFPGLRVYRHRLFESNMPLEAPAHPEHVAPTAKMGRPPDDGEFMVIAGHFSGAAEARQAMGISWMTRRELAEALPPAYTEFLGRQIQGYLGSGRSKSIAPVAGTCYNPDMSCSVPFQKEATVPKFLVSSKKFPEAVEIEAEDEAAAKAAFLASHDASRMVGVTVAPVAAEKPAKVKGWQTLDNDEKAAFLLSKPTIADRAWTALSRNPGESREAFINRVLLGIAGL